MMRRWLAVLLAATVVSGCGSDSEPARPAPSYVAMGDSYVSGPGIAPADRESGACLRSRADYPALLARKLDIKKFTDVSCGGAITDHLVESFTGQSGLVDAQLDAVSEETRLITVGIGGNDGNLYEGLFNSCVFPKIRSASGCRYFATEQAPKILDTTRSKIVSALEAIATKAPNAKIILVGYLRILPDSGACPGLDIGSTDVEHGSAVLREIDATQRAAAKEAGVTYVSLRDLSEGHDACAGSDAWVNGLTSTAKDGLYLHPKSAGMKAVAELLADDYRGHS
jgi:lysophospholipase L1-like esterase